jgi:hypothetical protein
MSSKVPARQYWQNDGPILDPVLLEPKMATFNGSFHFGSHGWLPFINIQLYFFCKSISFSGGI